MKRTIAATDPLVHWMERKRRLEGYTHEEFAALIGMSTQGWGFYRRGQRRPGLPPLRALLRAFPEDREAIYAALEEPIRDAA